VVQPVAPAYAARSNDLSGAAANRHSFSNPRLILAEQTLDEFILDSQIRTDAREKLASHAARGEAAILSRAQMDELSRTRPALYAKLMRAYRTASTPNLTAEEKKLVDRLTAGNIEAFKAGTFPGCSPSVDSLPMPVTVASAGSLEQLAVNTNENCSTASNMTGAWVIISLFLAVILGVPLICTIAPALCQGTRP